MLTTVPSLSFRFLTNYGSSCSVRSALRPSCSSQWYASASFFSRRSRSCSCNLLASRSSQQQGMYIIQCWPAIDCYLALFANVSVEHFTKYVGQVTVDPALLVIKSFHLAGPTQEWYWSSPTPTVRGEALGESRFGMCPNGVLVASGHNMSQQVANPDS